MNLPTGGPPPPPIILCVGRIVNWRFEARVGAQFVVVDAVGVVRKSSKLQISRRRAEKQATPKRFGAAGVLPKFQPQPKAHGPPLSLQSAFWKRAPPTSPSKARAQGQASFNSTQSSKRKTHPPILLRRLTPKPGIPAYPPIRSRWRQRLTPSTDGPFRRQYSASVSRTPSTMSVVVRGQSSSTGGRV